MSGLVDKVQSMVRGRSRSRSRKSLSQEISTRNSQDHANRPSSGVSSPTTTAWHVHKGARNSMENATRPPVPQIDDRYRNDAAGAQSNFSIPHSSVNTESPYNGSDNIVQTNSTDGSPNQNRRSQHNEMRNLPIRDSSLQHNQSQSQYQNSTSPLGSEPVQYPYTVPRRKESLGVNRLSKHSPEHGGTHIRERSIDLKRTPEQYNNTRHSGLGQSTQADGHLPEPRSTTPLGTEIDQALSSLSVKQQQQTSPTHQIPRKGHSTSNSLEHVKLPPGFNLDHKERTMVETNWMPAVTHENIYPERTEVVREAITRDVHVHHYYTYVQPIKVTEVLPTKHYVIDAKTGLKVEIPEPVGWVTPRHLLPRSEDTSNLTGWTRHYLVNSQYPRGIAEPPPPADHMNGTANGVRPYQHARV